MNLPHMDASLGDLGLVHWAREEGLNRLWPLSQIRINNG